jgi:hypothetical protein
MSNRPIGENNNGIFSLLFRETGLFLEQAFQWSQEQSQQGFKWAENQSQQAFKWVEDQAKEDRLMLVDDERRKLADAETRQKEAEARLLEQVRLAKQAGLDVEAILQRVRK